VNRADRLVSYSCWLCSQFLLQSPFWPRGRMGHGQVAQGANGNGIRAGVRSGPGLKGKARKGTQDTHQQKNTRSGTVARLSISRWPLWGEREVAQRTRHLGGCTQSTRGRPEIQATQHAQGTVGPPMEQPRKGGGRLIRRRGPGNGWQMGKSLALSGLPQASSHQA